jgi:hypothetical protein
LEFALPLNAFECSDRSVGAFPHFPVEFRPNGMPDNEQQGARQRADNQHGRNKKLRS